MKISYTCEVCGKSFATEDEAKRCESAHNAAKKREELRKRSTETISDLFNKHVRNFKELPVIELTKESQKFIEKEFADIVPKSLAKLVDTML
jgi:peptide subunit release factor 1 (eRF1)